MKIVTKKWWSKLPPHEAKEIKRDLQQLDSRVSRIEGQLMPSPWEPKIKEKK